MAQSYFRAKRPPAVMALTRKGRVSVVVTGRNLRCCGVLHLTALVTGRQTTLVTAPRHRSDDVRNLRSTLGLEPRTRDGRAF